MLICYTAHTIANCKDIKAENFSLNFLLLLFVGTGTVLTEESPNLHVEAKMLREPVGQEHQRHRSAICGRKKQLLVQIITTRRIATYLTGTPAPQAHHLLTEIAITY